MHPYRVNIQLYRYLTRIRLRLFPAFPVRMATALPFNVHVSKHPCLRAKLSLLRSQDTGTRETKDLVNDIATILAVEALAGLDVQPNGHLTHQM